VVEDAVESVASQAFCKGLEIFSYVDPHCVSCVHGDSDRLRQIVLNLLSNAIKFTKIGQVYVCVNQDELTATHATFRFNVYDSGIGIAKTDQKKLFRRFSQVDTSITRAFGGTGLGLAISKEFVELMNGTFGVESNLNEGSLFFFTAMFQIRNDFSNLPAVIEVLSPKQQTVLLVSNSEKVRINFISVLEDMGLKVISVESTEQMIEMDLGFDIVVFCPSVTCNQGDGHLVWTSIQEFLKEKPSLKRIILCPIHQLKQVR
jgi:two-component system sensor histidine kinase/response regulator